MADAKIINYGQQISAGTTAIPDNNSTALDIESTDAKDYVVIDTTDGSETLTLKAGGSSSQEMVIDANGNVSGPSGSHYKLFARGATDTQPTVVPYASRTTTGLGSAADDQLSLIAGGVEGIRIVEDSSAATIQFGQDNYDPMIQQASGTAAGSVGYSFKGDTDTGMSSGAGSNQFALVAAGANKLTIEADGVAAGSAYSINNHEFEVNDGTNSVYFNITGTEHYIVGNKKVTLYGGGATTDSVTFGKYGTQRLCFSMAESDGSRTSDTNVDQPVYLDESSTGSGTFDTLVIDQKFGCVGAVTLTHDIAHIKIYNAKGLGTAGMSTVKITQNASSAKTISYSSFNIYSDNGSTTKNGQLLWSGGAAHVMSTGTSDIDILQFSVIPTTDDDRDVYACVIGQNFS